MTDKEKFKRGDGMKGTVADFGNIKKANVMNWGKVNKSSSKPSRSGIRGLKGIGSRMKKLARK